MARAGIRSSQDQGNAGANWRGEVARMCGGARKDCAHSYRIHGTRRRAGALSQYIRHEEEFMRDILRGTALALVFTCAASISHSQQSAPTAQQPQGAPTAQQSQGKSNATRDTTVAPSEDKIVGPPNAEAGQHDPNNLGGSPAGDATGGHRDLASIPGATPETFPAKYSPENAARAELSIMQVPVKLTDEQKKAIWDSVATSAETKTAAGDKIYAEPGVFLPTDVEAEVFPDGLNRQVPEVQGLKYVKADNKVLLVAPSNGIVRGVIEE
jgi:hypothetical protein